MADLSDNEILERMHRGDTGALGLLYIRYAGAVTEFAYRFIRVKDEADDITHNVFCSLWENRDKIDRIESIKNYLFKMTRNAIFSSLRHNKVATQYASNVVSHPQENQILDGDKEVTTKDLLEIINLYISRMPELQRKAFSMSRFENKTYQEIAEELDISPRSVQYYISQALAELRKLSDVLILFTSLNSLNNLF